MRNADLEATIHANPDDDQAYLVYADWLQQQGDPLGSLIVEHARAIDGDAFLAEHETDLLGPLADYKDMLALTWRNGFIRTATIANTFDRSPNHTDDAMEFPVEDLLGMLLDHEAGRFLRELTIGIVDFESNDYDGCMTVLGKRHVPSLRKLYIGAFSRNETELNWSDLGTAGFFAATPNLGEVTFRSGSMSFRDIDLPELEQFSTITGGLKKDAIAAIASAHWPKLACLNLDIGSKRYGSDIAPSDLQPILDGENLPPSLWQLGLTNYEHADALIPLLATSKILPRIKELVLANGALSSAGATALIAAKDAFAHLSSLVVAECCLDSDAVDRLHDVFDDIVCDNQRWDARWPDDRYIGGGE